MPRSMHKQSTDLSCKCVSAHQLLRQCNRHEASESSLTEVRTLHCSVKADRRPALRVALPASNMIKHRLQHAALLKCCGTPMTMIYKTADYLSQTLMKRKQQEGKRARGQEGKRARGQGAMISGRAGPLCMLLITLLNEANFI